MIRVYRIILALVVNVTFSAHMLWRGRKMDHRQKMAFVAKRQRLASVLLTRGVQISSEVRGSIPADKPILIVANHIGTLDPWILASKFDVAFVAKSEMDSWPIIGFVCKAVGIIFAHRKSIMKTAQTVDEIRSRMRSGVRVLVFPEGTTSDGRELLPFKTGSFEAVANMEDGFVVPVYFHVRSIAGKRVDIETRIRVTWSAPQTLQANVWALLGLGLKHYVIRIGEPIAASGRDRKDLARRSQEAVQRLKTEEEAELRETNRPR